MRNQDNEVESTIQSNLKSGKRQSKKKKSHKVSKINRLFLKSASKEFTLNSKAAVRKYCVTIKDHNNPLQKREGISKILTEQQVFYKYQLFFLF